MELRCTYCQTMFSISRDEMLAGLEHMEEHKQSYYDAHCPNCRRANRVERARMERFFPDWKKTLRTMAKESSQAEAAAEKTAATAPVKTADAPKPQPRRNAKK
jgi:predicted  nucleic acid-binding Zn-ribbon protein